MHNLIVSMMIVLGSLALAQVIAPAPPDAEEQAQDLSLSVISMSLTLNDERLLQASGPQSHSAFAQRDPGLAADIFTLKDTKQVVETSDQILQLFNSADGIIAVIDLKSAPPRLLEGPVNASSLISAVFTARNLKLQFGECHLPQVQPAPPGVHETRQLRPICDTIGINFVLEEATASAMAGL